MEIQAAIKSVMAKRNLSVDEMASVMLQIMTGECTESQIGGFLVGLRMKGETVDELSAAARVMRELSTRVEVDCDYLVDTAGTGGDSSGRTVKYQKLWGGSRPDRSPPQGPVHQPASNQDTACGLRAVSSTAAPGIASRLGPWRRDAP